MKPLSAGLVAILSTNQFYMADCYTFTLVGGGVEYLTSADQNITVNGHTFVSVGPLIDRSNYSQNIGLQVDQLAITIYPTASDTIFGESWLSALRTGLFDGATVQLDRCFMSTFGSTAAGTVTLISGRVADVALGRSKATITVNSWKELLNIQMPRNYFQSGCGHCLYDVGCGVSKAAYSVTSTVQYLSGTEYLCAPLPGYANGFFSLGQVKFNTGVNAGLVRSVLFSDANPFGNGESYFELFQPVPTAAALGDSVTFSAGCDKSISTCETKFGNVGRFRGFPFIPAPETAV